MEKEYIVTLHKHDNLDSFYEEMESQGNCFSNSIPERIVKCVKRRSISRNTHYLLTDEEAESLKKDKRVLAVELLPSQRGLKAAPHWTQTAPFQKSNVGITSIEKNWGLLRCIGKLGISTSVSGWSYPIGVGETSISNATIKTTSSGKNVDVVIVDSHINPLHPEFAVNADGTGGTRVNQFDWFQYSEELGFGEDFWSGSPYSYSYVSSNHGTHVAGTVAGNTQGWARDANIYNLEFSYVYGEGDEAEFVMDWALYLWDYLIAFHQNKPPNPKTGKRNPTITNHSWGYSYSYVDLMDISSVGYRNKQIDVTGTYAQRTAILEANGVPVPDYYLGYENVYLFDIPQRVASLNASIQDAISQGIVVISSAGNSSWKIDVEDGIDYDNYIILGNYLLAHSQGSSPGSDDNVICVGSLGTNPDLEQKSNFSDCGPRVDVYAPGSRIISSVYNSSAADEFKITLANDPRNSFYKIGSISGTSMSSPQVAGAIACLAEQYSKIDNKFVLRYLKENSKAGVNEGNGTNVPPYRNIQGSPNRLLNYKQERLIPESLNPSTLTPYGSVITQPRDTYNTRSSSDDKWNGFDGYTSSKLRLKYPRRNVSFFKISE